MRRLWRTVMSPKSRLPSGTWAIPAFTMRWAGSWSILVSSKPMVPAERLRTPEIALRMEVFPAPLAPMSVMMLPASTFSETPLTASTLS